MDNPYLEDTALLPEIWALGFRNPWRCSFDAARPAYFMCGDVGQVLNYSTSNIFGVVLSGGFLAHNSIIENEKYQLWYCVHAVLPTVKYLANHK